MSSFPVSESETRAVSVTCEAERFVVELSDGRAVSVPYAWFPRLAEATAEERAECELIGRGRGIHWLRFGRCNPSSHHWCQHSSPAEIDPGYPPQN